MKNLFLSKLLSQVMLVGLLGLTACGQNGGGSEKPISAKPSCKIAQETSAAFQIVSAEAQARQGFLDLLIKFTTVADLHDFRKDIEQQTAGQVRVARISENLLSVQFQLPSRATQILDQYISQNRIETVEKDETIRSTAISETNEVEAPPTEMTLQEISRSSAALANPSGKEIIVAIIDTGVDYTHRDLAPYMWKNPREIPNNGIDDDGNGFVDDVYGWDFANNDSDPMADDTRSYHGTHVAGIVKQAALLAEQGMNVKIMALKYLNENAAGRTSVAIQAIDYAIQNGAQILNNSWGSFSYSSALADAIERVRAKNALFIAAAGNGDAQGNGVDIDQNPFFPASYPINNIISVAASDSENQLADWSNYGAINVDFSAPGVKIKSTRNGNTYATLSGTSMAAPFVAGLAALIWSLRPELTYSEVRKIIARSVSTSNSLDGKVASGGSVSRERALELALSYEHNPHDTGGPEATPSGVICAK